MLTVAFCVTGDGNKRDIEIDEVSEVITDPGAFVWLDVERPSGDDFHRIAEELDFHELAIEDAVSGRQLPKVDIYDDLIFVVMYGLVHDNNNVEPTEVSIFVGKNYVVTVRDEKLPVIEEIARLWRKDSSREEQRSPGMLLYAILDGIVDDYFPIVEAMGERIDHLDDELTGGHPELASQHQIHDVRRKIMRLRRVIGPEREVINRLIRSDAPLVEERAVRYFEDVADNVARVLDQLDAHHELIVTLFDVYMASGSRQLEQTVRTLTAWSIMLMATTLIAGIYGMNFTHMPELDWTFGYVFALGIMAAITAALFIYFRRQNWL